MYYVHKDLLMASEDSVFKAIAHPAQRGIITLLAVSTRSVKELTAEFEVLEDHIRLQHMPDILILHTHPSSYPSRHFRKPFPKFHTAKFAEI